MFADQTLPRRKLNIKSEIETSHIFSFKRNATSKLSKSSFDFFHGNNINYMKEENL